MAINIFDSPVWGILFIAVLPSALSLSTGVTIIVFSSFLLSSLFLSSEFEELLPPSWLLFLLLSWPSFLLSSSLLLFVSSLFVSLFPILLLSLFFAFCSIVKVIVFSNTTVESPSEKVRPVIATSEVLAVIPSFTLKVIIATFPALALVVVETNLPVCDSYETDSQLSACFIVIFSNTFLSYSIFPSYPRVPSPW